MLAVPLILFAILVGVLFYSRTQKAGRELELRRIESDLVALSRQRQAGENRELVPVPAKARRARFGR